MSSYIGIFFELNYVTPWNVIEMRSDTRGRYAGNECDNWREGQQDVFHAAHRSLNGESFEFLQQVETVVKTDAR